MEMIVTRKPHENSRQLELAAVLIAANYLASLFEEAQQGTHEENTGIRRLEQFVRRGLERRGIEGIDCAVPILVEGHIPLSNITRRSFEIAMEEFDAGYTHMMRCLPEESRGAMMKARDRLREKAWAAGVARRYVNGEALRLMTVVVNPATSEIALMPEPGEEPRFVDGTALLTQPTVPRADGAPPPAPGLMMPGFLPPPMMPGFPPMMPGFPEPGTPLPTGHR